MWENVQNYEDVFTTTSNIETDPLFYDASTGDYQLTASSPAIDAAVDFPIGIGNGFGIVDGDGDGTPIRI